MKRSVFCSSVLKTSHVIGSSAAFESCTRDRNQRWRLIKEADSLLVLLLSVFVFVADSAIHGILDLTSGNAYL